MYFQVVLWCFYTDVIEKKTIKTKRQIFKYGWCLCKMEFECVSLFIIMILIVEQMYSVVIIICLYLPLMYVIYYSQLSCCIFVVPKLCVTSFDIHKSFEVTLYVKTLMYFWYLRIF